MIPQRHRKTFAEIRNQKALWLSCVSFHRIKQFHKSSISFFKINYHFIIYFRTGRWTLITIEFSLNVFTEFNKFGDKNICHYSKRAQTCYLLCNRLGCCHSTSKKHVRDRIFKLSAIHASVIYQIPWIQWIPVPFRENSIATLFWF